jgi:hypothetical protein
LLSVSSEFNHGSVCWGSPWSQHALLSLLMDVIENERCGNDQSSSSIQNTSGDSIFARSGTSNTQNKIINQKVN